MIVLVDTFNDKILMLGILLFIIIVLAFCAFVVWNDFRQGKKK